MARARRSRRSCGRRSTRCAARSGAGPVPRPAPPVTTSSGWVRDRAAACNGHRRRHDEPRRRLALPRARAEPRTRRHDGAAALRPRTATPSARPGGRRRCARCAAHEAYLRTYQHSVDASSRGRVPAARPALPALGVPLAHDRRATGSVSSTRVSARAGVDDEARRLLGRVRAELEFLRVEDVDRRAAGAAGAKLQHDCAQVHAAIARRYFHETRVDRVERVTWCRGACGSVTPRPSSTADVVHTSYNEARISPARHAEPVHDRTPRRRASRRRTCSATATTGAAGCTCSICTSPTASSPWSGRRGGDGGPHAEPRRHDAWDAIERAGPDRPVLRVPRRDPHDRVRRRGARRWPGACGETQRPAAALAELGRWIRATWSTRPAPPSVSTTAVEALARPARGVPGLRPPRARGAARRRHPGPLRVRLPLPRRARRASWARRTQGESHAWIEAWVGDWHPLDPTSGSPVGERHVLVARGRDYADVAPLKGVYHGGASLSLDVSVELTRVA